MNLQNVRVFLKVAELEHITHAAEELGLSQPAVTKIIQGLELDVQLDLIERQGRRIVLTHAGKVLQQYARQLFTLERRMEEELASLRDVSSGEVTLAANTSGGVYLLPPIVAHFRAQYPLVTLNISILNSREIVDATLNWTLDFGIIEGDISNLSPFLHVQPFARDRLILVVAPTHRWSQQAILQPAELGEGELILREQGSGVREVIAHQLHTQHVQVLPLLTLTDNEAIKQMVINGVGAAILSHMTVQRELASGDLVQVPIANFDPQPQLSLIRRADKQFSRAASAFYSALLSKNKGEK